MAQLLGVLILMPSGVCYEANYISLLEIPHGSDLDRVASLIAYCRLSEIDWAWVAPAQGCDTCQFSSGKSPTFFHGVWCRQGVFWWQRHTWDWGRAHSNWALTGSSSLRFETASILALDTYVDTVKGVAQVGSSSLVSGLVADDKDWKLGDSLLPKHAAVLARLHVDLTAI